jgi:hypothetical protein
MNFMDDKTTVIQGAQRAISAAQALLSKDPDEILLLIRAERSKPGFGSKHIIGVFVRAYRAVTDQRLSDALSSSRRR